MFVYPACMLRWRPLQFPPACHDMPFALGGIARRYRVAVYRMARLHTLFSPVAIPATCRTSDQRNSCPHHPLTPAAILARHAVSPPVGIRPRMPLKFPPAYLVGALCSWRPHAPLAFVAIHARMPPLTPFSDSGPDSPPLEILAQMPPSHPLEIPPTCSLGIHCNFCLHAALAPVGIHARMTHWRPLEFPPTCRVSALCNSRSHAP